MFVGLSALGNVMSVIFAQGRIIQQLGREGVLPFSNFFASPKPFNSPMVGLLQHFVICVITIIAPPPGDAYDFILNLISYPMNIINFAISVGLLWIYWQRKQGKIEWNPPIKAGIIITSFFALSNLYLIIAPYIPPSAGESVYQHLPYWIQCVVAWGVFGFGGFYWVIWARVLPRIKHYKLVARDVLGEDGFWRVKIIKVPVDSEGKARELGVDGCGIGIEQGEGEDAIDTDSNDRRVKVDGSRNIEDFGRQTSNNTYTSKKDSFVVAERRTEESLDVE